MPSQSDIEYFIWLAKESAIDFGWVILGYIPILALNFVI